MPIEGHFRTRHRNNLWRSNIADLPSTKDLAPNTIFVAVDTEPWLDSWRKLMDLKTWKGGANGLQVQITIPAAT
ncbi:hypothetical protein MY3296_005949 [Beauveria thailandica]